ncbi:DUF3237 domain-containing protein [Hyphomonas sp.]|jgi:hypothetical protein|uniref:DUF3237 domain-containing protein n=1 Tax=Hyphomonas sp. TaxID=87 RepID=UPI0025B8E966|nr:DUF3237 domain-containing protein [Hyphomonas sp.]
MNTSVPSLPNKHLMTLRLDVDSAGAAQIGKTPEGRRTIAPVKGGTFEGERLSGKVLPGGADWVRFRTDGTMMIDVRLTLQTDDRAMIYLAYQGRFIGAATAMADLAKGKTLGAGSYSLVTVAKFECGDEKYAWLNDVVAVATGEQSGFNPIYTIFEIG